MYPSGTVAALHGAPQTVRGRVRSSPEWPTICSCENGQQSVDGTQYGNGLPTNPLRALDPQTPAGFVAPEERLLASMAPGAPLMPALELPGRS
jgi:hypothetical protein